MATEPVGTRSRAHRRGNLRFDGDVALLHADVRPRHRLPQPLGGALEDINPPSDNGHRRALFEQAARTAKPDPRAAAGNERCPMRE